MIVLELLSNGDLHKFLNKMRPRLVIYNFYSLLTVMVLTFALPQGEWNGTFQHSQALVGLLQASILWDEVLG